MAVKVNVRFDSNTEATVTTKNTQAPMSFTGKALAPYEYFLSGYIGCLHATLNGVLEKKKISYAMITYDVEGIKRTEVPTTLETVKVVATVKDVPLEKQSGFEKSMQLAERYCSISVTLQKVADIDLSIHFEN